MTSPLFFALFFGAAFGLSYGLAASHLSLPLRTLLGQRAEAGHSAERWLLTLMECVACTGFHVGCWATVFGLVKVPSLPLLLAAIMMALATATINLILGRITGVVS